MWLSLGPSFQIPGGDAVDFALTVQRVTGDAQAIPGTQTAAAIEQNPDAPSAASGSYNATSGSTTHHQTDLSSTTNKMIARGGVIVKLGAGATPGWIEGTLSVMLSACAKNIGTRSIEIPAALATATPSFYILGRVPACNAGSLRAALVSTDANDLQYLFFVRGVNDPDAPGTFVALNGGTWTDITDGNTAVCVADLSVSGVTPANYHQLDVMIAIRLKSGGSGPTGIVRVAAAMSYA